MVASIPFPNPAQLTTAALRTCTPSRAPAAWLWQVNMLWGGHPPLLKFWVPQLACGSPVTVASEDVTVGSRPRVATAPNRKVADARARGSRIAAECVRFASVARICRRNSGHRVHGDTRCVSHGTDSAAIVDHHAIRYRNTPAATEETNDANSRPSRTTPTSVALRRCSWPRRSLSRCLCSRWSTSPGGPRQRCRLTGHPRQDGQLVAVVVRGSTSCLYLHQPC